MRLVYGCNSKARIRSARANALLVRYMLIVSVSIRRKWECVVNNVVKRRRRGAALEEAVLDAAWQEIAAYGYEKFTVDGVAARARTSKSVLYLRWSSRGELAEAAIKRFLRQNPFPVPDTGSLREDVLSYLREASQHQVGTKMLLFAQFGKFNEETGTTMDNLIEAVMPTHESVMAQIVRRAVGRGEADPDKLSERIISLPADLFRFELIMAGRPLSEEAAEEIVDTMFLPLVRCRP